MIGLPITTSNLCHMSVTRSRHGSSMLSGHKDTKCVGKGLQCMIPLSKRNTFNVAVQAACCSSPCQVARKDSTQEGPDQAIRQTMMLAA